MSQDANRVRIGERLRQDAIGAWHRAERAGQVLTLRILREDLAGREDARMLFEEEMRRIERLDHPALLEVLHASRKPPRPGPVRLLQAHRGQWLIFNATN